MSFGFFMFAALIAQSGFIANWYFRGLGFNLIFLGLLVLTIEKKEKALFWTIAIGIFQDALWGLFFVHTLAYFILVAVTIWAQGFFGEEEKKMVFSLAAILFPLVIILENFVLRQLTGVGVNLFSYTIYILLADIMNLGLLFLLYPFLSSIAKEAL